jgi:hypothetical protein
VPYVPLRHGLLAPLTLFVIADLARGRGLLGRLFTRRGFGRLSEASFSLFSLQMPAGVWFCIAVLSAPRGTTAQLLGMIAGTLLLSVVWAEAVQRSLIERLRSRGRIWRGRHAQARITSSRPWDPAHPTRSIVKADVREPDQAVERSQERDGAVLEGGRSRGEVAGASGVRERRRSGGALLVSAAATPMGRWDRSPSHLTRTGQNAIATETLPPVDVGRLVPLGSAKTIMA